MSETSPAGSARRSATSPPTSPLFERALTHGSQAAENYERLEFLGDRVLGLVDGRMAVRTVPRRARRQAVEAAQRAGDAARSAPRSRARSACSAHLRLGKQARDDGASDSDNVLGDVMEALIGALYLDGGFDAGARFVRRAWGDRVHAGAQRAATSQVGAPGMGRRAQPQDRRITKSTDRSGPHHAPRFTVRVSLGGVRRGRGEGTSKQEAETAAAAALLAQVDA